MAVLRRTNPFPDPFLQQRLARLHRRRWRTRWGLTVAAIVGLIGTVGVGITISQTPTRIKPSLVSALEANSSGAWASTPDHIRHTRVTHQGAGMAGDMAAAPVARRWGSPTSGEPLDRSYLPAGWLLLVSFRPVAVMQSPTGQEVLAGLNAIADPLLSQLQHLTAMELSRIEQVLIGWVPSVEGRPPRLAIVARLREPFAQSPLLRAWGQPRPVTVRGHQYYVSPDGSLAYFIADDHTFAVMAPDLLGEVLGNAGELQPTSRYLEALLPMTDSDRHLSVMFDREFVRDESRRWLPPELQPIVPQRLDEITSAPAGVFSVHLEPDFFAELIVHCPTDRSSGRLIRDLEAMWLEVPYQLRDSLGRLDSPRRGRRLVGRFPAMVKAAAINTEFAPLDRMVRARVMLPRKAGPNFAWAGPLVLEAALHSAAHSSWQRSPMEP